MKIQINIEKSHLFILIAILLILITTLVIGQSNIDFGHSYNELTLRNSQGSGLVSSGDIQTTEENGKTYVKLNVLRAKSAENALAARCDPLIIECGSTPTNNACRAGYYQVPGWFSFSSAAQDNYAQCNTGGKIALCCKSN